MFSRIAHEWALNVAGQLERASGPKQWDNNGGQGYRRSAQTFARAWHAIIHADLWSL